MIIQELPGSIPIGKPRDWINELDGECGTIYAIPVFNEHLNMTQLMTFYKPTAEELVALADGGMLRLGIYCNAHPVFTMGVLSPEISNESGAVPRWDLGGVIHPEAPPQENSPPP